MKILVCMSVVPDTTTKISFTDNDTKFNTAGVQFIINPYDEFALTKALKIKAEKGGTVTVIHVGNATSESVIRKALAIGADDAIRIDTEAHDGISVAKEIATYIQSNPFDLIFAGRESIDYNGGIVAHALGELLNLASVSPCVNLTLNDNAFTAETFVDGGKETFSGTLPAVIGSQKGLVEEHELIIPNMRGIMMARSKPLNVIAGSGSNAVQAVKSYAQPTAKQACKMIDANNVEELVNLLQNEAKVL